MNLTIGRIERNVLSSILEKIIYGLMEPAGMTMHFYVKCVSRVLTQVNVNNPIKTYEMWSSILGQIVQCTVYNVHTVNGQGRPGWSDRRGIMCSVNKISNFGSRDNITEDCS